MSMERRQFWRTTAATFVVIFLVNAFVITASFFLFFHSIELDEQQIRSAALMTFGNVIFLSVLIVGILLIFTHFTVTKPVQKIQKGLEEITNGDLSVRIAPEERNPAFDMIIRSINRMTAELSSVETLKTDFISNVSHEIKTPIAIIQNYSSMLESDAITQTERKEYAKAVFDAAVRLSGLVTNILKLNRLENQQIQLNRSRFDLSAHLTECLLSFEDIWEEKQIEIVPEIDEDVYVNLDRELLSIVWNNLLSNAFKFTEPGGTVFVTLKKENGEAVVSVRDTGCGIEEDAARHIFDKFFQGDTSHSAQGNGLGLALVKRIIDITGGSIEVSSIPGEGSTFCVRLRSE